MNSDAEEGAGKRQFALIHASPQLHVLSPKSIKYLPSESRRCSIETNSQTDITNIGLMSPEARSDCDMRFPRGEDFPKVVAERFVAQVL